MKEWLYARRLITKMKGWLPKIYRVAKRWIYHIYNGVVDWTLDNHRLAVLHVGPLSAGLYWGISSGELKAGIGLLDFSLVEDGLITFLHIQFYLISFEFSLSLFEPVYVMADKE